jgi:hypothetical protein
MKLLMAIILILAAFEAWATPPPEYAMDETRRDLIERALTLKKGERRSEVIAKLGKPTSERGLGRVESNSSARAIRYDVVTWIKTQPSDRDQYIEVLLDNDDRLSIVVIRVALSGRQ